MKKHILFIFLSCLVIASCTKAKTDYEAEIGTIVTEHLEFKEVVALNTGAYHISIEALNGTFYEGYNEILLKITDADNHEHANISDVTFLPVHTTSDGSTVSGPHRYNLTYEKDKNYFSGYVVFTSESSADAAWELYIGFTVNAQIHSAKQNVSVIEQTNKNLNMTSFTGKDGEQYLIALVAPQKPKVAENELVAGIYKYNKPGDEVSGNFPDPTQFSYSEVTGYTLLLDPRMPEASMGNHSSPNNKDLTQQSDGLYHGIVNYTMTGNWTLNFILLDQDGRILRGTEVPLDFTPGVEGVKSELFIDILF